MHSKRVSRQMAMVNRAVNQVRWLRRDRPSVRGKVRLPLVEGGTLKRFAEGVAEVEHDL